MMDYKKRILFVTDTFGYGGAEKQITFVAEGLLKRGYIVGICNLNQGERNEGKRGVSGDIELFTANITYKNAIKTNYELIAFTLKTARSFKPNVIVGFKQLANFCTSLAGMLLGIPSVISERADPFREYANIKGLTKIKLWFINHATGGVFQTEQASCFYRKQLRDNSVVIPNPIFIKGDVPLLNYSALPKTVISLGRIDNKQKRLDVMLEAFAKFHIFHPDYTLKIYGNGEDEVLVRQWIFDKGLNACVQMMGVSTNPVQDLGRSGIFFITSDYEGISNSLLEAMACGLPVVSTDHTPGGARLLINDGENGLLAPMGDVDALCHALRLYAENSSLAERCGRNAKQVLERFAPERILDEWDNYVKRICK